MHFSQHSRTIQTIFDCELQTRRFSRRNEMSTAEMKLRVIYQLFALQRWNSNYPVKFLMQSKLFLSPLSVHGMERKAIYTLTLH